jgi:branched-chain amino acid transport system substrate-binding protein
MEANMLRKICAILIVGLLLGGAAFAGGSKEQAPVKIGFYADLSAGSAQWGTDAEKGAKLRIKEINAAGGLLGRKVELVSYDCKQSPTEAVKAYTKLAQEDKVSAVQGSLLSNTALAVAPVAEQMKVAVVSRALDERATTPKFDPNNPDAPGPANKYFFLSQPSAFQQAAAIAGYAIDELKMNTFTSLYTPGNAYALYLAKGFEYYVKKRGKQMLGNFEFQAGDMDYKAQLTKMKPLNPDGLFIPNYVPENANAVKQARELGLTARFLGNNSWYKPMDQVAGAAADGAYFPNNITFDDPSLQDFFKKYQAEYKEEPRLHSFSGYDDVGIICDAIKRANSADAEKVREALESTKGFKGTVGDYTIDPATHRPVGLALAILKFEGAVIKSVQFKYVPKNP